MTVPELSQAALLGSKELSKCAGMARENKERAKTTSAY